MEKEARAKIKATWGEVSKWLQLQKKCAYINRTDIQAFLHRRSVEEDMLDDVEIKALWRPHHHFDFLGCMFGVIIMLPNKCIWANCVPP